MQMSALHIVAVVIIVVFYAAYLAKQATLRKRGISGDRLGKGNKPRKTLIGEILLLVVTFTLPVVQIGSVWLSIKNGGQSVLPEWMRWCGAVIAVVGVVFFISAMITMRDNWRAGVDSSQQTELVTLGIYRISRNPAFVGFDLFYIGMTMMFPNIVLGILTIFAITSFHMQILAEEKYMTATFGSQYAAYSKKVRRYI